MPSFSSVVSVFRRTWRRWRDVQATRHGAGLAFYALFTLAPMLVLIGWFTDAGLGFVDIRRPLSVWMSDDLIGTGEQLAERTAAMSKGSMVLTLAALVYGPLRFFLQLQGALNVVWSVRAVRGAGAKSIVTRKLVAFAAVASTCALLFAVVVADGVFSTITKPLIEWSVPGRGLMRFGFLTALITVLFQSLPDARVPFKPSLIGAGFTAAVLLGSRAVVQGVVEDSDRVAAFGDASSVVGILLFSYYAAQVLLIGASFTWAVAEALGTPIEASAHSVKVRQVDHSLEG